MAPLGSPTKTAISPSSTTGLPMIEPSANPGSGTGFSHDVPSALRADQGGPDGPTPNATKPDASLATPWGRRPSNGAERSVHLSPSSDDQAKATSPAPVPRITALSPAVAAWAMPPAHRSGSNGAAAHVPAASRIQIPVTAGCAQSPSPSPRVRTRSPHATECPIACVVPGRGSLAQVAPSSADDQAIPCSPAAPPAAVATTASGRATTSLIEPTSVGIGQIDELPGEVRSRRDGRGRRRSHWARRPRPRSTQARVSWSPPARRSRSLGPQPASATHATSASRDPARRRGGVEVLSAAASSGPTRSRGRRSGRSGR